MKGLVIGLGEVGRAHLNLLKEKYETYGRDIEEPKEWQPEHFEILHLCIRYSDRFLDTVRDYAVRYKPAVINVCSTVPPGTCEKIGQEAVHSTTRGLHPNLEEGLLAINKHIGGPKAEPVARYFRRSGISCITHRSARTTELAHILNNAAYGVNLMFADEMAKICRHYGVDYSQAVTLYTMTNNTGYRALDHEGKCRMILTPPGGRIGGHCVTTSAGLIADAVSTPMLKMLVEYGN